MTTDPNGPADTTIMGIIHQALRRDLERAAAVLGGEPAPSSRQRKAIARHLVWMMAFLRAHHESEDNGLYPVVRERRPDVAPLLDTMDRDHTAMTPAITAVESAARAYARRDDPAGRMALLGAIEQLQAVLLPHLQREEDEVMPVVSDTMTDAEWRAIEKTHNLDGKSLRQLGLEGHWLIDDADDADRARVLGLVPPVPRMVLLHGFGPSYRLRRNACWQPAGGRRVQKHGHVQVETDAAPSEVWSVLRDLPRIGEWSHECVAISFVGGATRAEPGVQFRGRNRQGAFRWGRRCEIITAEFPELSFRTVPTAAYPDSTVWTIRLGPTTCGGTRIDQTFDVVQAPAILEVVYAVLVPAHRDRNAALTEDLDRLASLALAEASRRSSDPLAS